MDYRLPSVDVDVYYGSIYRYCIAVHGLFDFVDVYNRSMDCVMVDKGPVAHKPPSSSGCQSSPLLSQGSPTKQNRSAIKYGELIILGYVKIYHIYTCTCWHCD